MRVDDIDVDVIAFLICDSVVRDSQTGKVSIQGVFDTVFAEQVPALHPAMAAYFRLKFDKPHVALNAGLAFATPSGMRNITPTLPINTGPIGAAEGWANIQGMLFSEMGPHCFELLIDGECVARYILNVQKMGTAPYGQQLH